MNIEATYPGIDPAIRPYLARMSEYAVRIVAYEDRIARGLHVDKEDYLSAHEHYRVHAAELTEFSRRTGRDTAHGRTLLFREYSADEEARRKGEIQW